MDFPNPQTLNNRRPHADFDGGPAHSRHSQDIGVDFTIRFGFAENNSKNLAGCDTRTSHPAITELRKVRHDNFAPCDSLMLHLATSRYRTLSLSPVAPCDAKSPLLPPKIAPRACGAEVLRRCIIAPPLRPCIEPPRHRHWPHLPACRADLSAVAFYRAVASAKADGEGGTLA